MTGAFCQDLFIKPFNTQFKHIRRHSEISELVSLLNCFRPLSRRSSFLILSPLLFVCFFFPLPPPVILHFISSPLPPSLFAEQPSPGQLLIRARNDRCFAHQQYHLFCLSTNSICAVHIYFRRETVAQKQHTYLQIYKRSHTDTHYSCIL